MGAGQQMMTDGEIEAYVRIAWLDHVSIPVICLKTGLTRGRVDCLITRLGLPRRIKGSSGDLEGIKAKIRALWATGLPVRKMALELGLNVNQITGHVQRLKLTPRGSPIIRTEGAIRPPKAPLSDAQRLKLSQQHSERVRAAAEASAAHEARMRAAHVEARRIEAEAQLLAERMERVEMERERVAKEAGFRSTRSCQWLNGEPRHQDFCKEQAILGKPYCPDHWERSRERKPILQTERN